MILVTIEHNIQLLVFLLFLFATLWNVYVLFYTKYSKPLKTRLAKERPLARGTIKAMYWIVVAGSIYLVNMSFATLLRNSYTLPTLTSDAPFWVVLLVIEQYLVTYAFAVLPATLLFFLTWALREHDRIADVQLENRYEMKLRNARPSARRRNA